MQDKLTIVGQCPKEQTGTKITFKPDAEIFEETHFDYATLREHFQETAFLTKGVKIIFKDEREGQQAENVFHYEGGIREFVEHINKTRETSYDEIFYCEGMKDDIAVEVAFQHYDGYNEVNFSYVNNINTVDGGTHVMGFRSLLQRLLTTMVVNLGF